MKSHLICKATISRQQAIFGGTAVKRSLWGWMLLCILAMRHLAFGQTATTSLRGTIKDPSGALVPGATVTLTDNATGKSFSTTSNSTGSYRSCAVLPAKYTIKVTAPGFGEQIKTAELLVNQPATIDFTLTVQSSTVTVDVSAIGADPEHHGRLAWQFCRQCGNPGPPQRNPQRARSALAPARRALSAHLDDHAATAAAARSTAAAPTRAMSPSMASTTTTR